MAGMMIGGIGHGRVAAAGAGGRATRPGAFRLPEPPSGAATDAASGPDAAAGTSLTAEVPSVGPAGPRGGGDASGRDRRGAARAKDLLRALTALQAGMLTGGTDPEALERLAALAEGETPADPVLADALAGISLRARVEIARHGMRAAIARPPGASMGPTETVAGA